MSAVPVILYRGKLSYVGNPSTRARESDFWLRKEFCRSRNTTWPALRRVGFSLGHREAENIQRDINRNYAD